MTDALNWDDLERPLDEDPLFHVAKWDRLKVPEIRRQSSFLSAARIQLPAVYIYANANAGRRGRGVSSKEGIRSGVFDLALVGPRGAAQQLAYIEFKGTDGRGRPGKLTRQQVDFGNLMHRRGIPVACFYHPIEAIEWAVAIFDRRTVDLSDRRADWEAGK